MSSNYTDTTNQTGGSVTVTLAFVLGSIALGAFFYFLVWYASPVIRRRFAHMNNDTTNQAPILGLMPSDIEAFPTFIYRGVTKSNENGMVNSKGHIISVDCSICLCDLEENDVVRVLPVCRHFFHVQCIDVWLHSNLSCPICRAEMRAESAPLTGFSVSPPLPEFSRYVNLQNSGQGNAPTATEEVADPQIGEITEIEVEQESEIMGTTFGHISKRSLCDDFGDVRVDIQHEANIYIESCYIGSPSQRVPMDEGSPEIQVEVEDYDVQLQENV